MLWTATQSLYTMNDKVVIAGKPMDYTKDVNIIPYEKYGDMLSSGELTVMRFDYDQAFTIVMDYIGNYWKVTYQKDGFKAILTRVE